jgi:hypothetical protein
MTVFLNNTLALVNSIFPKRENRDYCHILREAAYNCIHKNYKGHPPCKEIYKLFTLLDCSSKEVKFLSSNMSKCIKLDIKQHVKQTSGMNMGY